MVIKRQHPIAENPNPTEGVTGEKLDTTRRQYIPQVVELVDEESAQEPLNVNKNVLPGSAVIPQESLKIPVEFPMKLPLDSRAVVDAKPVEMAIGEAPKKTESPMQLTKQDLTANSQENEEKEVVSELFQPEARVAGYPEIIEHKRSPFKGLAVWAIVVIAAATAIGALIVFFSQGSVTISTISVTPVVPSAAPITSDATPTPGLETPSPIPVSLAKNDLTVQILNGSGIAGAANKMKVILEESGYTVENVGNAPDYTYENTEIFVKPGNEGYLQLLEADLKDDYVIGKKEATLEDNIPYDARIIVGKE